MKMKTSRAVILTVIAVLLAAYILFPFFLVVLNSFKTQSAIVTDPISAAGASFKQFTANLNAVVNNKNFVFWRAFELWRSSPLFRFCFLPCSAVWPPGSSAATRPSGPP